jgi:hypothetical protein
MKLVFGGTFRVVLVAVAMSALASCGLLDLVGGGEETTDGGAAAGDAAATAAAAAGDAASTAAAAAGDAAATAMRDLPPPPTDTAPVLGDASASAEVGGTFAGDAGMAEATGDAGIVTPPPPEEIASPSLPLPENASPELTQLMEERERVNREVQRLNSIVDRDINTDPTSGVRLNRHVTASQSDIARLNRLSQERRGVNRQIQELQGQQ